MHIPENYLSPSTCAVMAAAMVPVWTYCGRKLKKEASEKLLTMTGAAAAFSFLIMMFNIPVPGGTTAHAVGGTLLAVLLGPEAACIALSLALLLQAALFGDGGVLAIGANCFNIAFVLPFAGFGVYKLFRKIMPDPLAAGLGAYIGINCAALFTAILLGLQPVLFTDAAGKALYCPYGLGLALLGMLPAHLTLAGAAEAIVTAGAAAFIKKNTPELFAKTDQSPALLYWVLGGLILLCPLGLLAGGTAWGEWAPEELPGKLSYIPSGMEKGFTLRALIPDYSLAGMPEWTAYILSAITGAGILIIVFRLLAGGRSRASE